MLDAESSSVLPQDRWYKITQKPPAVIYYGNKTHQLIWDTVTSSGQKSEISAM